MKNKATIYDFPPWQVIRKAIHYRSDGSATEYIDDDPVRPGDERMAVRVAIENQTSNMTRLRVGVYDGTTFHPAEEHLNPQAGRLYWTADPIYITEGERLRTEIQGATSGDVIMIYVDYFFRRKEVLP